MAPNKITLYVLVFLATVTYSKAKLARASQRIGNDSLFARLFGRPEADGDQDTGPLNFTKFGALEDPITEEVEERSAPIARGRGLYVTSALDGSHTHILISIVFIKDEYKGSTFEIQGSSPQFERVREVAVVGGTGKFRLGRGFRCNITVLHY